MKAALVLCCLALFVALYAADYVCDPDGNNKPDCSNSTNQGVLIRNFWDPTRYWLCNSTGSANSVPCETSTGFLASKQECVSWDEWTWTPPCP